MRALVTGSHGFAGRHLVVELVRRDYEVFGLGSSERAPEPDHHYFVADLLASNTLEPVLHEARPDVVFHLAARTGRGGPDEAVRTIQTNVEGTRALFDALRRFERPVRVVHVGTSAQYGVGPGETEPVTESEPQWPLGVYGWSKIASEAIALSYQGLAGIEVVAARPFNHVGPGEPAHLACSGFAKQIASIEAGADPVLTVGNLEAVRDLTDVRDLVAGYVDLGERGTTGRAYNLCSGRVTTMNEVLGMLLDKSERSIEVRADPAKARPSDLPRQVGSFSLAHDHVGWRPTTSLDRSLNDLLDEWRARLKLENKR